jgi:hypothetical protein
MLVGRADSFYWMVVVQFSVALADYFVALGADAEKACRQDACRTAGEDAGATKTSPLLAI